MRKILCNDEVEETTLPRVTCKTELKKSEREPRKIARSRCTHTEILRVRRRQHFGEHMEQKHIPFFSLTCSKDKIRCDCRARSHCAIKFGFRNKFNQKRYARYRALLVTSESAVRAICSLNSWSDWSRFQRVIERNPAYELRHLPEFLTR